MVRLLLTIQILALNSSLANAFGSFQMPKIQMPWDNPNVDTNKEVESPANSKALKPGDTIAVIGASGNVGKLVSLRLSDTYNVNGIVRDASSVEAFFDGRDQIKLFEADLLDELKADSTGGCPDSLRSALSNANAIVICTGTTAFPTKAWSRNEEKEVTSDVISALIDSKFDVKDAITKLDDKGLNTPKNVDDLANQLIFSAWNSASKVQKKRAILLSSIGVQRRDAMPFPILNACGVLDAKASAEQSLINESEQNGYNYSIIRPGQLFGGPYDNNYYLGTLFQLDKDAQTQDVEVGPGDELLGDTLRSTLAEVTAQICESDCALNMDFAVVNVKGDVPSAEGVQMKLKALDE
mmetsp:Transcript_25791/g.39524  ORF Transcript_25791/g.39524 Transcript_25791/m.39524 type:complete len:353 (+) Transcript_25791:139-1197(+)|eukprot:CAMPEP_0194084510 /NCGR_PEP_ID=MMETSP0149-20130528/13754_1 /TAXON_ID=122233 /ORGANISM="Chaetoceros debilis, Strain MM31A-1" /LENGTH=352 /DNA_ID=CAMNT_0038767185 /DNA_START=45 /DNA_END=1103 /DNA_ORIENTATION=+